MTGLKRENSDLKRAAFLRGDMLLNTLLVLIGSNYLFKAMVALLDTGPFYFLVHVLRKYLKLEANQTVADEIAEA